MEIASLIEGKIADPRSPRRYYKSARLEKPAEPVKKVLEMPQKYYWRDKNFMLDTEGQASLTFHNSRKVYRKPQTIIRAQSRVTKLGCPL